MGQALAGVMPAAAQFILVDDENFRTFLPVQRRIDPFLERDGQYWGQPADSDIAVRELERLRAGGAKFIAFAWPAFWWLEHYPGLAKHLEARYRGVLRNDRLIIFDLA